MGIYATRGQKRDSDQEKKSSQFFLGAGDFLLHWSMWALGPITRMSIRLGLSPDFYNYLGLTLGVFAGIFIGMGRVEAGGWAIALSGIADILDGRVARLTGVASDFGDFIDSTFDRYVEVAAFLGFLVLLRSDPYGPFLAAFAMGGALIVSYARARGEVLGVLCTGGLMQRGERLVLTCLTCLVDRPLGGALSLPPHTILLGMLALIGVTTLLTAIHRTVWIAARLREKARPVTFGAKSEEAAPAPLSRASRPA
jgi:CDP-diacylglycerol--glycerol-3-phosphate 3-phosphatidyltransferase